MKCRSYFEIRIQQIYFPQNLDKNITNAHPLFDHKTE